jgi:hypothetical protein
MTFTSPIPGNEMKPPGEIFFDQRKRAYLNPEGADRPLKSPIPHDTLVKARQYRLQRLRAKLQEFDCAAILLYSPINIRYALDVTNIQVWTAHDAMRYALIFADGPAIMFEFKGCHPAFVRPGWRAFMKTHCRVAASRNCGRSYITKMRVPAVNGLKPVY